MTASRRAEGLDTHSKLADHVICRCGKAHTSGLSSDSVTDIAPPHVLAGGANISETSSGSSKSPKRAHPERAALRQAVWLRIRVRTLCSVPGGECGSGCQQKLGGRAKRHPTDAPGFLFCTLHFRRMLVKDGRTRGHRASVVVNVERLANRFGDSGCAPAVFGFLPV